MAKKSKKSKGLNMSISEAHRKIVEIAEKIAKRADFQESLDEVVIEFFSSLASNLNNQGPEAQLRWLLEQGTDIEDLYKTVCKQKGE